MIVSPPRQTQLRIYNGCSWTRYLTDSSRFDGGRWWRGEGGKGGGGGEVRVGEGGGSPFQEVAWPNGSGSGFEMERFAVWNPDSHNLSLAESGMDIPDNVIIMMCTYHNF